MVVLIGEGNLCCYWIIVLLVVVDGVIYMFDLLVIVVVMVVDGMWLWLWNLILSGESMVIFGGGLVFGSGKLFVIMGYGELVVIDLVIGLFVWCQDLDVVVSVILIIVNGIVYVVGCNSCVWVIDVEMG